MGDRSLDRIFSEIHHLLPESDVISDFRNHVFVEDKVDIELETSTISVSIDVQIDVIAYVIQYGIHGEDSHLRVIIGLGGVKIYSGVRVADLCFATLRYGTDLKFNSVDFYERIT